MLTFMGENKRLLNIHEHKFVDLTTFHENTAVFQANTNAPLKNLETQVRQLALAMQNQSKDAFPSGTRKKSKGLYGGYTKKWKSYRRQKRRREEN